MRYETEKLPLKRVVNERAPTAPASKRIAFGAFTLDLDRAALKRGAIDLRLRPKSFDVLCYLVQNRGRLVSKDELLSAVWPRTVVTEGSITQCVIDIRRALGDEAHTLIRTVPRRGYLFDADVSFIDHDVSPEAVYDPRSNQLSNNARPRRETNRRVWLACLCMALLGCAALGVWRIGTNPLASSQLGVATNAGAQAAYRQARFFYSRRSSGDLTRAGRLYEEALRADAQFALAWVGLAAVYRNQALDGTISGDVALRMRRYAIEQALRIDPALASAHVEASKLARDDGDVSSATQHSRAAASAKPDDPIVLAHLSNVAAWSDRMDDAIALARRAVALDPLGAIAHNQLANLLLAVGRFEEAEAEFAKESDVKMTTRETASEIGFTLILERRFEEAFTLVERWPAGADKTQALAMIGEAVGRPAEARAALHAMNSSADIGDAIRLAEVHAFLGELEKSFDILERASERATHDGHVDLNPDLAWQLRFSPFLRALHADPRWSRLRPPSAHVAAADSR